ncbi:MAG: lysine--tRNA ligase [Rickettsiales bacterium]|jgi:lysyl-tRNA synthetase class 2|nr:lysine--tRNA ligase [Rickettsiales bacterium]
MVDDLVEYLKISKTVDEQKLKKLGLVRELGIEPYPHIFRPTIHSDELLSKYADLETEEHRENDLYSVAGRLMFRRKMGKASFYDLYDENGKIQIYLQQMELSELERALLPNLDIGDFIGISGFVFRTKTGEISIHCRSIKLLSKSIAPMPEKFHGLSDLELRYRQRFVDMTINPAVRDVFKKRCFIVNEIRSYLMARGFTEVETPILQPIYGGASARPFVTHHNVLDSDLFLRISPELYLKRLIAGGFEKVFDIAKNFRNEGCDATHNPEFTMIEWYEAYTDYNYQMEQVENMIESIVKKLYNGETKVKFGDQEIDYQTPWRRLTMWDALRQYAGIEPNTITKDEVVRELDKYKSKIELHKSKGELLAELFEETCEKYLIAPTFVIDHPVEISPLTKKHRDPSKDGLVERFELFIAQKEVSNCYSELNDPVDQGLRLYEQEQYRAFDEEAQPMDKNFIHCVEFAMPPLGGVGIGMDRLVMLLTDQQSIRDVIAFPIMKLRDEDMR